MRAMTMWVAAVALAWSAAASAVEVGGIRLDEKANVGGQELVPIMTRAFEAPAIKRPARKRR